MKKIFTLVACAVAAISANAQVIFSPHSEALAIWSESMNAQATLVVGTNQISMNPVIWDVENEDFTEYSGKEMVDTPIYDQETWEIIGYEPVEMDCMGTFHAISNNGIAVGEFGAEGHGKAFMVNYAEGGDVVYLAGKEGENSSAFAITADGSIIAGYHFQITETWQMIVGACIWKDNGETRIELPNPSEEELGFAIDYCEARWISEDGSVIGGFVQDQAHGQWLLQTWHRNANGEYVADATAGKYYETEMGQGKPYMKFSVDSSALSANGVWMPVTIQEEYDWNDWENPWPDSYSARYNIAEDRLEIMEGEPAEFFGIANDGTAVGRASSGWMMPTGAAIWPAGSTEMVLLTDYYEDFTDLSPEMASALSYITPDAKNMCGTAEFVTYENPDDPDDWGTWNRVSFVAAMPQEIAGIKNVENNVVESTAVYDIAGRKLNSVPAQSGMYIVNGKKYIKK